MNRLPDKVSAVTVSQPVDGRKNRRPTRKRKTPPKPKSANLTHVTVDPKVWAKARSILNEGRYERIEIVDHETVIVR